MKFPFKQNKNTRAYHDFLVSRANTPFQWGRNDCALFAADGIRTLIGVDIAADFRGRYDDEASAMQAIRDVCGGTSIADAAAYCAQRHGLTEWQTPLFARRGDLVIVRNGDGSLIAGLVHLNGRHVVSVGDKGMMHFPISHVVRSWNVLKSWHNDAHNNMAARRTRRSHV